MVVAIDGATFHPVPIFPSIFAEEEPVAVPAVEVATVIMGAEELLWRGMFCGGNVGETIGAVLVAFAPGKTGGVALRADTASFEHCALLYER